METSVVIAVTLLLVGMAISWIQLLAWHHFDRPRHALFWAIAFGVACFQWAGNLLVGAFVSLPAYRPSISLVWLASMCLFYVGFRIRARLPLRLYSPLGGAAFASAGAAIGAAVGSPFLAAAPGPLFDAWILGLCGASLFTGQWQTPAHRAVAGMLFIAAAMSIAIAILPSFMPGTAFAVIRMASPAIFLGSGLVCIFLLAVDLAAQVHQDAVTDPLTGLLNRRGLEEAAAERLVSRRWRDRRFSIAILDLDQFATVDSQHGRAEADRMLRAVAACLRRSLRAKDSIAHVGGEQFVILLNGTDLKTAADVVERVRGEVAALAGGDALPFPLTASFGVASLTQYDTDLDAVFERAGAALHRSKAEGNRVTVAGQDGPSLYLVAAA